MACPMLPSCTFVTELKGIQLIRKEDISNLRLAEFSQWPNPLVALLSLQIALVAITRKFSFSDQNCSPIRRCRRWLQLDQGRKESLPSPPESESTRLLQTLIVDLIGEQLGEHDPDCGHGGGKENQ